MTKYSLQDAVNLILEKGVTPTELSHELGFQDTSMVYRYKTGKTKSTSAIRASIIYDTYGYLLDDYVSVDHLRSKAETEEAKVSKQIEVCGHIFDRLLVLASYKGKDLRQRLLKFIAEMDRRD